MSIVRKATVTAWDEHGAQLYSDPCEFRITDDGQTFVLSYWNEDGKLTVSKGEKAGTGKFVFAKNDDQLWEAALDPDDLTGRWAQGDQWGRWEITPEEEF